MKQIIFILLTIMCLSSIAQTNSLEWLNLKGDVKYLRQIKYNISNEDLIPLSSETRRFRDIIFMSIAQQLLIDNTVVEFSKTGKIENWAELDAKNDTILKIQLVYDNYLLPDKMIFVKGGSNTNIVEFRIDESGNFICIIMDKYISQIVRNENKRIIANKNFNGRDSSKVVYDYVDEETINMQLFDGENLIASTENKFNHLGDIIFDGRLHYQYEYDNKGNWLTKLGLMDDQPVIKFIREIEYQ